MSQAIPRLYEVTASAKNWRDIGIKAQRAELALKMAIAITIIATIAAAATCVILNTGGFYKFTLYPLFGGIPVVLALLGLWPILNFNRFRNGFARNLKDPAERKQVVTALTTSTLKETYKTLYKKKGGLTPLVHEGYLLEEQAAVLRQFFEVFAETNRLVSKYTKQSWIRKEIEKGHYPQQYLEAKIKMDEMCATWDEMKQEIASQYSLVAKSTFSQSGSDRPLTVFPIPRLLTPVPEAKYWNDVNPSGEFYKRLAKVVILMAFCFLVLGIVTASYFCFTTTHETTLRLTKEVVERSNGAFATFPIVFGGIAATGLMAGFLFLQFNKDNHASFKSKLKKPWIRDDYVTLLSKESLKTVYTHLRNTERLSALVQSGFLSISQADTLLSIFKEQELSGKHLKAYRSMEGILLLKKIRAGSSSNAYHSLSLNRVQLERAWQELRQEINLNLFPEEAEEVEKESTSPSIENSPVMARRSLKKSEALEGIDMNLLPNEILALIFENLSLGELSTIGQVGKNWRSLAKGTFNFKAKQYGLSAERLGHFLQKMKILIKTSVLPRSSLRFHLGRVDLDATMRSLRYRRDTDLDLVGLRMGKAVVKYMKSDPLMLDLLLYLRPNLDMCNEKGSTPLMMALEAGNFDLANTLIEEGADTNAMNHERDTPLTLAASANQPFMVEKLLNYGADLSINHPRRKEGDSPLHLAAKNNDIETVQWLLSHGADKNRRNKMNKRAQDLTTDVSIKNAIINHKNPKGSG